MHFAALSYILTVQYNRLNGKPFCFFEITIAYLLYPFSIIKSTRIEIFRQFTFLAVPINANTTFTLAKQICRNNGNKFLHFTIIHVRVI